MGLRSAVTALVARRRQRRTAAAVADHDVTRSLRPASPPTTRDVATGGQTGSTVG